MNLPPAIQVLLAEIAGDAGRARAQTLLAIQGADPNYVRPYLAAMDAALGAASPGVAGLEDLLRQAEEAVESSQPTVLHQHVISQVVLRRFVEDVPPGGRQVARIDLQTREPKLIGTKAVGFVDNFVPVDSQSTENLWQQVENDLYKAIEAGLDGTAIGKPTHLLTLRRAVALHFVRNPQTLTVHNKSFADAVEQGIERWSRTPFADESFYRRYGLVTAGPEGRRLGAAAAQGRLVGLYEEGGLFRLTVQRLYEKVSDRFDVRGVELLTPANASKEFLIGDLPAITINTTTGAAGLGQGVAVDQADEVVMPFAPRLLVVVGRVKGTRSIADGEVDAYNELQVRMAKSYVVHRPRADFTSDLETWSSHE